MVEMHQQFIWGSHGQSDNQIYCGVKLKLQYFGLWGFEQLHEFVTSID
jgi:hypothetical protein